MNSRYLSKIISKTHWVFPAGRASYVSGDEHRLDAQDFMTWRCHRWWLLWNLPILTFRRPFCKSPWDFPRRFGSASEWSDHSRWAGMGWNHREKHQEHVKRGACYTVVPNIVLHIYIYIHMYIYIYIEIYINIHLHMYRHLTTSWNMG